MQASLDKYESIMYDMAAWIAERTWGGHEAGCPRFATDRRDGCECIFAVLQDYHTAINERAKAELHYKLPDFTPKLMEQQAQIHWLEHELAIWRAKERYPHP